MEAEFQEIDSKNGWGLVYQNIRHASSDYKYTCKDARKVENKNLNRYRDVSPYDHTRVRLERGDKDYINASLVRVPLANRAYILTQGPLSTTAGHFWLMIWEQKSKAVLMLNKVIEKNTPKCHQYWPLGSVHDGEEHIVLDDVGLKISYLGETQAENYTIRDLQLTDLQSGEARDIQHFHYTAWPDFGVPESPSAFLNFLMAVRESGALNPSVGPPVVHCSAGIGRSGTFCLVDSCLVLVEERNETDSVNVQEILLEMRKYRMGLIQTSDQLRFSYVAIIEGAKCILGAKEHKETGVKSVCNDVSRHDNPDEVNRSGIVNGDARTVDEPSDDDDDDDDSIDPPPLPPRLGRSPLEDETRNDEKLQDESVYEDVTIDQEENRFSQEDGLSITSDRERELELRKRRRRERLENTAQKVDKMRQKQQESESWSRRRFFFKQLSLGLVLLMSTGILVYKYYLKS